MKLKSFLFLLLLTISASLHAQFAWFDAGIKVFYNSTWIINTNQVHDQNVNLQMALKPAFGLKLGVNFNEYTAITSDFIYTTIQQNISNSAAAKNTLRQQYSINSLDIPILLRKSKNGSYVEFGPQFSFVTNGLLKQSVEQNGLRTDKAYGKEIFASTAWGLVFGFGAYIQLADNLYANIGIRAGYTLSDITSDAGGRNKPYSTAFYSGNPQDQNQSYKASHPFYIGIGLELDYDLGYLSRSSCRRSKLLSF